MACWLKGVSTHACGPDSIPSASNRVPTTQKVLNSRYFSRFFQCRNDNFLGGILCCDIVLDFYSVKLRKNVGGHKKL